MPYSRLAPRAPHAVAKIINNCLRTLWGRIGLGRAFLIGAGQMVLMSMNVRNMAEGHIVYASIFTIINTMVWAFVVRKTHDFTHPERWSYAAGSSLGVDLGIVVHHYILQPHAITHLSTILGL